MDSKKILTLEELKKRREEYLKDLKAQTRHVRPLDKVGIWITNHVGSMTFFAVIFIWTTGWLGWNTLGPKNLRFDPLPGFVLWLFISNMIQLFLMPLIMIGQNLQSAHADARAETDLKINTLAALENETILMHLEYQNEMILTILKNMQEQTKKDT